MPFLLLLYHLLLKSSSPPVYSSSRSHKPLTSLQQDVVISAICPQAVFPPDLVSHVQCVAPEQHMDVYMPCIYSCVCWPAQCWAQNELPGLRSKVDDGGDWSGRMSSQGLWSLSRGQGAATGADRCLRPGIKWDVSPYQEAVVDQCSVIFCPSSLSSSRSSIRWVLRSSRLWSKHFSPITSQW